ncbi:HvfA family oxazolone/thioamide-modified RiPP metallophore [Lysobacter claricitrinus]|uniref:HvfA family oxazolone/thioamide-modified RiPP metallophore n=1 Tax=Lysobacter claricitrinus TaxID=3367728 RepID=UPI0037DAEAD6
MSRSLKTPALAALTGSLLLAGTAFASTPLAQGYMLSAADAPPTTTAKADAKTAEAKCGADKKAAEAKCGADKKAAEMTTTADASMPKAQPVADKKMADGKMAEGKCGEGKCGGSI